MPYEIKIPEYPESSGIDIGMRPFLAPLFRALKDGVSEFTFANIYLFRAAHGYRIARLEGGEVIILGNDKGESFFILPFGVPDRKTLDSLFSGLTFMKAVTEGQRTLLESYGYETAEDRDNFDYIYLRDDLVRLSGRRFHRKKNLVNAFKSLYDCRTGPLLDENIKDALYILEGWESGKKGPGDDYAAAKEALERYPGLGLCGTVFYIGEWPVAYVVGEELKGDTFVIHFEKGLGEYKGLFQYMSQAFAESLPARYRFINREQDLGDAGLRKSKMSWRPAGFIKKYRATPGARSGARPRERK